MILLLIELGLTAQLLDKRKVSGDYIKRKLVVRPT